MNAPTRPVLRYHGGKWRLAPWIIEHFPPHRVYVEPFGGAASVLLRKPRCTTEVYNDLDRSVVNVFRVLRDPVRARALQRLLALTPYARDEYETLFEPTDDIVEAARRFIARSFMGQNSKGVFQKSGFDTRVNADAFCARIQSLVSSSDEVKAVVARMTAVVIECDDAARVMGRFDRPDTLHYVDPPYLPETRSSKIYRHDMTERDHRALAKVLHSLEGMIVLSAYPSPLYEKLFRGWARVEVAAHTDSARDRTECLWINPAAVAAGAIRQPSMFDGIEATRSRKPKQQQRSTHA
jgi:DNA adenine methylase